MGQLTDEDRAQLAQMNKEIAKVKEFMGGPEDGDYQAIVKEFDFFPKRDGSDLFLKTVLTIQLDPKWTGCDVETIHSLKNPDRAESLYRHLTGLGLGSIDLTNIDRELQAALDVPVRIAVKRGSNIDPNTNEPYVSVYVNERLGPPIRGNGSDLPSDVPSVMAPDDGHPFTDDDIAF